jgi:hypothetical protein
MKNNTKKQPLLKPLTDEERIILLPLLMKFFLEKTSKSFPVVGKDIIRRFNDKKEQIGFKSAFNNSRFMKLTNYIRAHKLLKLVTNSKGYYVSYEPDVLEECALSLENRCESILAAARGLRDMAAEIRHERSMVETCPLGFTWND